MLLLLTTHLIVISFSRFSDFPLVCELPQYVLGTQRGSLFPSSLHPARFFIFFLSGSLLLVWGCDPWTFLSVFCEGVCSLRAERVGVAVWSLLPLSQSADSQVRLMLLSESLDSISGHFQPGTTCCAFSSLFLLMFMLPPLLRWVSSVHSLLGNKSHGKSKAETVRMVSECLLPSVASTASTCCLHLVSQIRPAICGFHSPWDTEMGKKCENEGQMWL